MSAFKGDIGIPLTNTVLEAYLGVPRAPIGIVLFASGSASTRLSSRCRSVASSFNEAGMATVIADLLTSTEESIDRHTKHLRFDVRFLASRLGAVTDWVAQHETLGALPVGYFGCSIGAAGALVAAAERGSVISAVVTRGGRLDLAGRALKYVRAPTLLIVGSADPTGVELNLEGFDVLPGTKQLKVVPGASHLFEEPGACERAAELARDWFKAFLEAERFQMAVS